MPGQPMTRRSRQILAELGTTPEWWEIALDRIASGDSPKDIADEYCIVFGAFMRWISGDEERSKGYAEALRIAAESRAHECIPIADNDGVLRDEAGQPVLQDGKPVIVDTDTQRDKLRIDTRLRLASKWDRGRYGDKEAAGGGGATIKIELVRLVGENDRIERIVIDAQPQEEALPAPAPQIPETI